MKLKPESREIDLYVSNRKVTENELRELSDYIEEYKRKRRGRKNKIKTKYSLKEKITIVAEPEINLPYTETKRRESEEPDLYVINKKLTKKERKELSEFIEQVKLKQKFEKAKTQKRKYSIKRKTSIAAEPKTKYKSRRKSAGKSK